MADPYKGIRPSLVAEGFSFLEAPVWDAAAGSLLVCDYHRGGIYRIGSGGLIECVGPGHFGIGGMAQHVDGGLVIAVDRLLLLHPTTVTVLDDHASAVGVKRYNDITTDGRGRMYAGSLDFDPSRPGSPVVPGYLHLIDEGGNSDVVYDDVLVSNGLGVSPDGHRLYHVDSGRNTLFSYSVGTQGDLNSREVCMDWRPTGPRPDGLAVTEDGDVLVALHEAGVSVVSPDGHERGRIRLPVGLATSLCFGGAQLDTLFIVTGGPHGQQRTGRVYRVDLGVRGLPLTPCKVNVSGAGTSTSAHDK